jgi:hypothetical protein
MKVILVLGLILVLFVAGLPAQAQEPTASIEVYDQVSTDGRVVVANVVSEAPGFIVIYADEGGEPALAIGHAPIQLGENPFVSVPIDISAATPNLYATLHIDDSVRGVFEYPTAEGADLPVMADAALVSQPFGLKLLEAYPQFISGGQLMVAGAITDGPGFVVVQADADGTPGDVLGNAPVGAGNYRDLAIPLEGNMSEKLWVTLHYDSGTEGTFEFGTVEEADLPVLIDGKTAAVWVSTVPTVVAEDQIVLDGENLPADLSVPAPPTSTAPYVNVWAVLSAGPGWVTVHQDVDGAPGELVGFNAVTEGLNQNVQVQIDGELATPTVWVMLHEDTGEVGDFEVGEDENLDLMVTDASGEAIGTHINIAPAIRYETKPLAEGLLTIDSVVIDANGWVSIRAIVDGEPGPLIGVTPVTEGLTKNVLVTLDFSSAEGAAIDQVLATLHYDTDSTSLFDYAEVAGADLPVSIGGVDVTQLLTLIPNR